MKIAFNEKDIIAGLRMYIQSQGIDLSGKDVTVDFTSGRKGNGLTADVNIMPAGTAVQEKAKVVTEVPEVTEDTAVTTEPASAPVQAEDDASDLGNPVTKASLFSN